MNGRDKRGTGPKEWNGRATKGSGKGKANRKGDQDMGLRQRNGGRQVRSEGMERMNESRKQVDEAWVAAWIKRRGRLDRVTEVSRNEMKTNKGKAKDKRINIHSPATAVPISHPLSSLRP